MIEHEIIDLTEARFEGIMIMNVNNELTLSHNLSLMNKYHLILSRRDNRGYHREVLIEVLEVLESNHFVVDIQYQLNTIHIHKKSMKRVLLIFQ